MDHKTIDEKELKNVVGGVTREQFYEFDAVKDRLCTTCGGVITLQDGVEADGRLYTVIKCSNCNSEWKQYFDASPTR